MIKTAADQHYETRKADGQKGVVGKLVAISKKFLDLQVAGAIEDQDERQKIWDEHVDHIMMELQRFRVMFPQISLDDTTEHGKKNLTVIAEWLTAHKVAAEMQNLKECLQDAYRKLVFDPRAAGRTDLGGAATGQHYENKLGSADFAWLLSPHADASKPEDRLSAAEYKAKHPDFWADIHARETAADADYAAEESKKFLALRPQFISTDENIKSLLDELQKSGSRITAANLANVFDELVRTGKMDANGNVTTRVRGVTLTDFAGSDTGRDFGNSETRETALRWARNHTSVEIAERTARDRVFKALLDRS